jgi:NADH:ubiquinone oxidoreductase subunit F (NADH-binding)
VYETTSGFVGGQARAVIENIEGRENLPVTSWQPEAIAGLRGRPTLLSNAETYAQLATLVALGPAVYGREGTADEPGTTLLTIAGDGPGGVVIEVPFGIALTEVLIRCGYDPGVTVLMGGYHGAWLPPDQVSQRRISRDDLARSGATIGAGVVLPLDRDSCPVVLTSRIVAYLAGQSARRCGPCKNGLPALADATVALADTGSAAATHRVEQLAGLVVGRGACAHPDGTVRLIRSLLTGFPDEVSAHERGQCRLSAGLMIR